MKIIDDISTKLIANMVEDLSGRFLKYVSALNTMPEKYTQSNDSALLRLLPVHCRAYLLLGRREVTFLLGRYATRNYTFSPVKDINRLKKFVLTLK